jgi:hypothetical protein
MDLSSIRFALSGFSEAARVPSAEINGTAATSAFLLGENMPQLAEQLPAEMDLNAPSEWQAAIMDDLTQSDALEIDFPCGEDEPALTLSYNAQVAATEVRLDGVTVAMVRMREGHGPLRASAIRLIPDLSLAAQIAAQ